MKVTAWLPILGGVASLATQPVVGCEVLSTLDLPATTITLTQAVPAGGFVSDVEAPFFAPPTNYGALPAFCRVAATIRPVAGSTIELEVWLPAQWNGRFAGVGNGGNTGAVFHWDMAPLLARGYAVASTNTGHHGDALDGRFYADREKLVDFAERAVHEMTVRAKAIVAAHYGRPAEFSYWSGCSTGGRQGLTEAQRFPDDYDGISAGAPAANYVRANAWSAFVERTLSRPDAPLPASKLPLVQAAALEACDAADGVRDRVVDDPRTCAFDPGVMQCRGSVDASCLSTEEVEAVRSLYRGPMNPRTGEPVYPGALPTSEPMLAFYLPDVLPAGGEFFRHGVLGDPSWSVASLDLDRDVTRAEQLEIARLLTPLEANLSALRESRGKLLLWHGYTDGAISPLDSIRYYESVRDTLGAAETAGVLRLFMLPGVDHCEGGEGPDRVDFLAALVDWVERDVAPERIIATKPLATGGARTRPVCPYPQVARYRGAGSTDDAANFSCTMPAEVPR